MTIINFPARAASPRRTSPSGEDATTHERHRAGTRYGGMKHVDDMPHFAPVLERRNAEQIAADRRDRLIRAAVFCAFFAFTITVLFVGLDGARLPRWTIYE